jgi:hypothetical protein
VLGIDLATLLAGDITDRATILVDRALTPTAIPALVEAVRTLSSRGVASISAGYITASVVALAELASADLSFELVVLSSS